MAIHTSLRRHPELRKFLAARFLGTISWQMLSIAVGWQIYALTHRALDLGYVGLVMFLPSFCLSLLAGHVADRYDRVRIVRYTLFVDGAAMALFAFLSQLGHLNLPWIYGSLFAMGTAHAFGDAASQALLPSIVLDEDFPSAAAISSSTFQVASICGPALGGLIYGLSGKSAPVYLVVSACFFSACGLLVKLKTRDLPRDDGPFNWERLLTGLRYVFRMKAILGAISMDLFAVLLGGATALLPAYANDILHVGPMGLGVLRTAPAVGAVLMGLLLMVSPIRQRAGPKMFFCVLLFGLATIVFGLSRNFGLSLFCLVVMGAADLVSVVVRGTLVQMLTPPQMRGRVSAVNIVFIGASNELGEFESGVTAALWGVVPAVVIGGIGTCLVVFTWALLFPSLRKLDEIKRPTT